MLSKSTSVVEVEFRVEFVDGLFEVGAVYTVVGADCRRDVFVTEQHLDDFRVFARLEQHARIGVPQRVKVKLVRRQSVLTHKALEYRFRAGVCTQFSLVVGKHQIVRTDKRLAGRALLHPTGFLPFEQSGFQYVGHRHFAHARRRFGVRNNRAVVYDFAFRVAHRQFGDGGVDGDDAVVEIHVFPFQRKRFADAQSREHLHHTQRFHKVVFRDDFEEILSDFNRDCLVCFLFAFLVFGRGFDNALRYGIVVDEPVCLCVGEKLIEQEFDFAHIRQRVSRDQHFVQHALNDIRSDLREFELAYVRVDVELCKHLRGLESAGADVRLLERDKPVVYQCSQIVVDDGSVTAVEFFAQRGGHLHCDFGTRPAVKDFAHAFSVAVVSERYYGAPPSVVPLIDGTLVFSATDDLFLFRFGF